ncbi:MAG: CofH family radical SAM protein [Planctomycetota bacterium]|nr:CofH family radical SAM protein [Planctomycetota bacterium]MDI6787019.1 CofH family radical SAM protein [Planctomycetota bacterium]
MLEPKVILKSSLEGREISAIDAIILMQKYHSFAQEIHETANLINKRIHRDVVSFTHSKHISYTNICRYSCRYCSFFRKRNETGSFVLTIDDVLKKIAEIPSINEICIYGAVNTALPFSYYTEMLSQIQKKFPSISIKAFSPLEIFFIAKKSRQSLTEALKKLKECGLTSLFGADADILNDKLRKKICPDKMKTAEWIDIIKTVHNLGIKTSATMLYGHLENEIHIAEHLEILRDIQKKTHGFTEFTPMPFGEHEQRLNILEQLLKRGRREDYFGGEGQIVKISSISRIFFGDIIKNIQANWFRVGLDNAVKSLHSGANDLGETHFDKTAVKNLKPRKEINVTPATLKRVIVKIGKTPRQRKHMGV